MLSLLLENYFNFNHKLVLLANEIGWKYFEKEFSVHYTNVDKPSMDNRFSVTRPPIQENEYIQGGCTPCGSGLSGATVYSLKQGTNFWSIAFLTSPQVKSTQSNWIAREVRESTTNFHYNILIITE